MIRPTNDLRRTSVSAGRESESTAAGVAGLCGPPDGETPARTTKHDPNNMKNKTMRRNIRIYL